MFYDLASFTFHVSSFGIRAPWKAHVQQRWYARLDKNEVRANKFAHKNFRIPFPIDLLGNLPDLDSKGLAPLTVEKLNELATMLRDDATEYIKHLCIKQGVEVVNPVRAEVREVLEVLSGSPCWFCKNARPALWRRLVRLVDRYRGADR